MCSSKRIWAVLANKARAHHHEWLPGAITEFRFEQS
jgi:hypothetical protein